MRTTKASIQQQLPLFIKLELLFRGIKQVHAMNKYAMNQEKINKPYDCIINWRVNQVCNFRCVYCDTSLNSTNQYNIYSDRIEHFFKNTDKTYLICMTGGEPFLYPRYIPTYPNIYSSRSNIWKQFAVVLYSKGKKLRVVKFIDKYLLFYFIWCIDIKGQRLHFS